MLLHFEIGKLGKNHVSNGVIEGTSPCHDAFEECKCHKKVTTCWKLWLVENEHKECSH